ncbi:MAG TPA: glycosyltransferase [Candidatus Nanoarchaeia archaeon]|nr:glycosyltransferase [Candidatus Nanoarchaeia archaeon]
MEKFPKISMVTACYNHRNYIAETIESILAQNYPNLQYVVIDDGSTDGSWEVIKKYQNRLSHCERLEGYRKTPTIALNRGFALTDGEIMGWLNSDDILLPKSLFTIADIFRDNPGVEWFTGMATTINYASKIVDSRLNPKNKFDFLADNWQTIQQESTFWKRSLWERAGGKLIEDDDFGAFDTELWTRFFKYAEHYNVRAPLGAFRRGQQSQSGKNPASFLLPNKKYLDKMAAAADQKSKNVARLYRVFLKFAFILRAIPSRAMLKIPFFKKISYKILGYSFSRQSWETEQANPFKF